MELARRSDALDRLGAAQQRRDQGSAARPSPTPIVSEVNRLPAAIPGHGNADDGMLCTDHQCANLSTALRRL
jgi:hypothetical protein